MTKTLIVINGCMGVGKTAVAQALYRRLQHSVWLDGDWCWMMNPWVISEENKRMVEDNITYLLRARILGDGREAHVVEESLRRLPLYREMDTLKVDTTDLPVSEAVDAIMRLVDAHGARGA